MHCKIILSMSTTRLWCLSDEFSQYFFLIFFWFHFRTSFFFFYIWYVESGKSFTYIRGFCYFEQSSYSPLSSFLMSITKDKEVSFGWGNPDRFLSLFPFFLQGPWKKKRSLPLWQRTEITKSKTQKISTWSKEVKRDTHTKKKLGNFSEYSSNWQFYICFCFYFNQKIDIFFYWQQQKIVQANKNQVKSKEKCTRWVTPFCLLFLLLFSAL